MCFLYNENVLNKEVPHLSNHLKISKVQTFTLRLEREVKVISVLPEIWWKHCEMVRNPDSNHHFMKVLGQF